MSAPDKLRSDLLAQITTAARDLTIFTPAPEHRQAKATFWQYWSNAEVPPPAPETVTVSLAMRHAGDRRVEKWWALPGFVDWFTNAEEFKQRVEFLAQLALDNIEDILRDRQANATAKINAVKLIMEIGNKLPSRKAEEKYADEKIAEMDRKQLEQFIEKSIRRLPTPPTDESIDNK